jgi:hypothetical protein
MTAAESPLGQHVMQVATDADGGKRDCCSICANHDSSVASKGNNVVDEAGLLRAWPEGGLLVSPSWSDSEA